MGMKQQMKQSLGMTMTPQLQQAIKILQMSVMELQTEVTNALVDNPTLEEDGDGRGDEDNSVSNMGAAGEGEDRSQDPGQSSTDKDRITDSKEDFDWENYLEQSSGNREYLPSTKNFNPDDLPNFEQILSKTTTLYEHLLWQLRLMVQDPKEFEIGENIIGNLNDDGYLMVFTQELAHSLDVSVPQVESMLARVQKMDPPGVAARDLKECLLIQARQMDYYDDVAELIEKCLPELETKNYEQIAKKMNTPLEDVIELSKIVHAMEPKPGRIFTTQDSHYIVPDIYIVKSSDGSKYNIVLNEEGIPRLKISRIYQEQLAAGALKGETRSYIREKLKNAVALMRSIYQRQRTIFRVTEAILNRQMDFFEQGLSKLKPMVLKDIADELGLHESTISRVTTNKYVHTPQGIFELKYFFNSAIGKSDGTDDVASESVRQKIKQFISAENPKKPLSDQQLTKMLEEHNITIARRTVAKYREALGILPSSKRKKFF